MIPRNDEKLPRPAIVVPIYKPSLSSFEWISIARTFSILGSHPIFLLAPSRQVDAIHKSITTMIQGTSYEFHVVDDHWLDSIASYNHLLLTREFYAFYSAFTHILVAQLDSYVFRDELIEWCLQPWDYIGAPIYPKGARYGEQNCQSIGCGGFSLRHISTFLLAFDTNPIIINHKAVMQDFLPYNCKGKLLKLLNTFLFIASGDFRLAQRNNSIQLFLGINEDVVFGALLSQVMPCFKVPTYDVARRFSIDAFIEQDLSFLTQPPFGTHAWYSSSENINAWLNFMPELKSCESQL